MPSRRLSAIPLQVFSVPGIGRVTFGKLGQILYIATVPVTLVLQRVVAGEAQLCF